MTTTAAPATRPQDTGDPPAGNGPLAVGRNAWRGLTSMRTALVLLFLLAVAALPGALLPQRPLNRGLVEQYATEHPLLAPVLDRLGFFDVFAAPWFAAIYLLLMVSLVGCVLPRTVEHARALVAGPVAVPRNLARLPHHGRGVLDVGPDEAAERVRTRLRGWRVAEPAEGAGRAVSAERGHLREVGNLVFHLSLIGLLVGFAAGKLFGYEGQVIVAVRRRPVLQHRDPAATTRSAPGCAWTAPTSPRSACGLTTSTPTYLPNGQAASFRATLATRAPRTSKRGGWTRGASTRWR